MGESGWFWYGSGDRWGGRDERLESSGHAVDCRPVRRPAFAQEAPSTGESVVVTAEDRQETFQKQMDAERKAAEARRLFEELREGHGDRALACRTAAQAERDFLDAIQEARTLAKAAQPALKERLEERIKGMTDRRDNLQNVQDRLCKDGGAKGGTGRRPDRPRGQRPR